jgi:hypothetical protein
LVPEDEPDVAELEALGLGEGEAVEDELGEGAVVAGRVAATALPLSVLVR